MSERVHPDLLLRCRGARCGGSFYWAELLDGLCRECTHEKRVSDDLLEGLLANAGLIKRPKRRHITEDERATLL